MSELSGQLTPESEAEWKLLKSLYKVTGEAKKEGVSQQDIIQMLNFTAVSISAEVTRDSSGMKDVMEEMSEGSVEDAVCPECGEEATDALSMMGGVAEVRPCGCTADIDDIEELIE